MAFRISARMLKFSAAGLAALLAAEGYTQRAVIPTMFDRWTYGFGMTWRDDGTPVQKGDTITPGKAVQRSQQYIEKDEGRLKAMCLGDIPLTQGEYDTLVDFSYQYGTARTCSSAMVELARQGEYAASCDAYLLWKKSGGRDCSDPKNWGPNGCKGVWTRNQERRERCLEAGK